MFFEKSVQMDGFIQPLISALKKSGERLDQGAYAGYKPGQNQSYENIHQRGNSQQGQGNAHLTLISEPAFPMPFEGRHEYVCDIGNAASNAEGPGNIQHQAQMR